MSTERHLLIYTVTA